MKLIVEIFTGEKLFRDENGNFLWEENGTLEPISEDEAKATMLFLYGTDNLNLGGSKNA